MIATVVNMDLQTKYLVVTSYFKVFNQLSSDAERYRSVKQLVNNEMSIDYSIRAIRKVV